MDTHEKLMALHLAWMELGKERDLIAAQQHDVMAEIDALNGDQHGADWNTAQAKALRTRIPEDRAEAHRLWIVSMAHGHVKNGTVPAAGELEAEAIGREMNRIRGEQTAA